MHVSIGPLTVRLRPDVVENVWTTLGEALRRADLGVGRERIVPREHLS